MVLHEFEESLRQAPTSQTGGSIRVIWISSWFRGDHSTACASHDCRSSLSSIRSRQRTDAWGSYPLRQYLERVKLRGVLNPRQFLDQYVMPCVRDWQLDPLNVRKAVIAISQIDILADHVIIHQHPGFTRGQLANVRKATEQNTRIRLLVRDVHDTHKHGPLQRATATITTSERPMQNYAFQVGTPVH